MLGRERDRNHFEIAVADFATVRIVARSEIAGGAREQDKAHLRRFMLAIQIIEPLLLGVIGLVPIDDLVKVSADAGFLHCLMLIAPATSGHQNIAQTGFLAFL